MNNFVLPAAAAMPIEREQPRPGQESVWDYPRPPRVDPVTDHVLVILDGEVHGLHPGGEAVPPGEVGSKVGATKIKCSRLLTLP